MTENANNVETIVNVEPIVIIMFNLVGICVKKSDKCLVSLPL